MAQVIFARRVNHPGTKAQPFLRPAWEKGQVILKDRVAQAIGKLVKLDTLFARLDVAVFQTALAVQRMAQQNAPVASGRLKGSLSQAAVRKVAELHYVVGTNVRYARMVEEGTKGHPIFPKTAKVLRFVVKGGRTKGK